MGIQPMRELLAFTMRYQELLASVPRRSVICTCIPTRNGASKTDEPDG